MIILLKTSKREKKRFFGEEASYQSKRKARWMMPPE